MHSENGNIDAPLLLLGLMYLQNGLPPAPELPTPARPRNCLQMGQRTHHGVLADSKGLLCDLIMFIEMRLPQTYYRVINGNGNRLPLDQSPDQGEGPSIPQVSLSLNPVCVRINDKNT